MSTIGRGGRAPRGPRGTNATRPYGTGRPGADHIYTNGTILTLVDARPRAEALATKGGRILAVGTRDEALRHRGTTTVIVDLKGHTLLPGFVDVGSQLGDHPPLAGLTDAAAPAARPDEAGAQEALATIQLRYARAGVTTVQDRRTSPALLRLLARADAERRLILDVVAYPTWSEAALESIRADCARRPQGARLKIGGVAIAVDATVDCARRIDAAYAAHVQILCHCADEAAARLVVDAIREARRIHGERALRPILVHAGRVCVELLTEMKALGIVPDEAALVRGARNASPRESCPEAPRTADAPWGRTEELPAPPDPVELLHAAVNGAGADADAEMGRAAGLAPLEALRSLTTTGARLHIEEAEKGTLEPGKRADLVVLSGNPLSVAPSAIGDLRILETIKDGETIFDARARPALAPARPTASAPH